MADAGRRTRADRLGRYARNRDFSKTSEPARGAPRGKPGKQLIFVVQKHAARRLHWDFRLEWRGTLRSWAVPKGPSPDPADKRLAVEVEDHPIAYAKFAGDIPKGEYGAGHVDIWDQGSWEPLGDADRQFAKGHLEFQLRGRKLRGKWHLVRTRMQGKQPQWLLMKGSNDAAPAGAASARAARPRGRKPPASRGGALPAALQPQLATLVDAVPGDTGWVYELKYDGVRLLCRCDGVQVRCISRNGIDWSGKVGPVAEALSKLRLAGAWVDGELIATDPNGRSDFSLLQHVLEQKRLEELKYCVFDLLYWNGKDLRGLPLSQRKARLDGAFARLPADGPVRLADQLQSNSAQLLARVCNQHLEGLIAKQVDSAYCGGRSRDWLKIKCHREQEFVVGGAAYLPGRGTGTLSSLLVGVRSGKGALRYAGRVGGGFDARERAEWHGRVQQLAQRESPFDRLPQKRSGEAWHWMKPRLVIQVAFQDWTQAGILRQPRYLGLREDRDPKTVVREEPAHTAVVAKQESGNRSVRRKSAANEPELAGVRLSHPDRVLYPHDGITKRQLAEYFVAVGEHAMPHYRNRPLSILRNTHGSRPFFQKHFLEHSAPGLRVVRIRNADKDPHFVVCDSPEGLVHLAQVGAVELHSWGAVVPKATRADRLTFDLDPGAGLPYEPLREAALAIRRLLAELGLGCWVKTTGGKGLHVVAPLTGTLPDWDTAREFSRGMTLYMERLAPAMFTSRTGERNRRKKIFVDYLRNGFGATTVAAFSPRWRPGVGVSTPVDWREIDQDIRGTHFNLHNVPQRLARMRRDPWQGYATCSQTLDARVRARLAELGGERSR